MTFESREDAGRRLGAHLREQRVSADVVVGLPRGGVIVAGGVALALHLPLEVLVVRKIGHPWFREFAVGALGEQDVVVLDQAALESHPVPREQLDGIIQEETQRLAAYEARFHGAAVNGLAGKVVLLVDDGLATGASMEAAVLSARRQLADRIVVAAPVASSNAVRRLERVADEVAMLWVDPDFDAVGRYYQTFAQTSDDEVLQMLQKARVARVSP